MGGHGTPEVGEFAVAELAAAVESGSGHRPDGVVFHKIWGGRDKPKMPAFREKLTREQVNAAGSESGTFIYILPRTSADLSAEYRFTRNFAAYVSGRNVNDEVPSGFRSDR